MHKYPFMKPTLVVLRRNPMLIMMHLVSLLCIQPNFWTASGFWILLQPTTSQQQRSFWLIVLRWGCVLPQEPRNIPFMQHVEVLDNLDQYQVGRSWEPWPSMMWSTVLMHQLIWSQFWNWMILGAKLLWIMVFWLCILMGRLFAKKWRRNLMFMSSWLILLTLWWMLLFSSIVPAWHKPFRNCMSVIPM